MLKEILQLWRKSSSTVRQYADPMRWKRVFERQRVGINSLDPFPTVSKERLFQWSRESELAYACISKIVESAQDPDLIVQRRKERKADWETEYGHPLRRLMMRPNPTTTQAEFLGNWLASEQICGIFFAEIERGKKSGKAKYLWPLDPTMMFINPETGLYEWRYYGEVTDFDGNRNLFISFLPDPQCPWLPLAPLQVALGKVMADAMQSAYVRSFWKNSGVPSGIIKVKGRTLKEDQSEDIRRRWMRRYGSGGTAQAGPAVFDENAEYEKIGSNLAEIEGSELTQMNEARICGVFGVPPLLVNAYVGLAKVNQRASALESQRDFWINKMSPTLKRIRTKLQWSVLLDFESEEQLYDETLRLNWDMSQVMAMQEEVASRDLRARENFRAGMWTLNQALVATGQPVIADGDYYLRRANAIPINLDVINAQMEGAAIATARAVALVFAGTSQPSVTPTDTDGKPRAEGSE